MKKFITIIFIAFCANAFAQTNPITAINITLPANPDANVANWGTGTSQFIITATAHLASGRIDPVIEESRILVIIKKGGAKICGRYTNTSAPASNFNTLTKVWSGTNAASLLGQECKLAPGDYVVSVQFFGNGPVGTSPLSEEKIKPFTIKGNDQQAYQPPQPVAPAVGATFNEADIKKPITFRWTPVVPRPQEPVSYRLSVWQLMQGQTGSQGIKSNQPIITKDIDNLTQANITNITDGSCKPPLTCAFVWNVQALNREGKPIGANNGTSEISSFKFDIPSNTATSDLLKLVSPANGTTISANEHPKFIWEGGSSKYKLKIVEIIGDQSPESAFRTNKPFFEKDSLNELTFQYPPSAPGFIAGKQYVWNVQALNHEGNEMTKSFIMNATTAAVKAPTQQIGIEHGALKQNPGYLITVDDKSGPGSVGFRRDVDNKGRPSSIIYGGTVEVKPGDNRLVFHWKVNKPSPGQTYSIKIVEIIDEQAAEDAVGTNTPVFEEKGIKKTSFAYPASARQKLLDKGPTSSLGADSKKYAWVVTAWDENGKQAGQKQYILGVNLSF